MPAFIHIYPIRIQFCTIVSQVANYLYIPDRYTVTKNGFDAPGSCIQADDAFDGNVFTPLKLYIMGLEICSGGILKAQGCSVAIDDAPSENFQIV